MPFTSPVSYISFVRWFEVALIEGEQNVHVTVQRDVKVILFRVLMHF